MATHDRDVRSGEYESAGQPDRSGLEETVSRTAEQAQQKAGQVADQAQHQAEQVIDRVQHQARSTLAAQKGRAAEGLGGVADALRTSSQELRNQQLDTIADYTDQFANEMERASNRLREKNTDELVRDVEQFARQRPELFLSGALALGILAGRFLKSSSPPLQRTTDYAQRTENLTGYERPPYYG